ncbi:MAG: sulfatase [Planctomycetota bacterium]
MTPPNLLVITLHDTGRYFGCYGVATVQTPHIDRIAAQGVRCTSMFCTSPVCSPSRGAMNTGLYPQTNGLMGLTHEPWDWRLHDDARHIAQHLGDAGYETVLARFQHESPEPRRLGFDKHLTPHHRPGPVAARDLAGYLRQRRDPRPFYVQFGMFETHTPYDFGRAEPDNRLGVTLPPWVEPNDHAVRHFAGLQGSAKQADRAVGIVLDALDQADLADNTIVVFTVDHGLEIGSLRAKWSCYDAGLEIAYLIRWPDGGLVGGRTCDALLSNVDHTPTMLDLLGIAPPPPPDRGGHRRGISAAAALRSDGQIDTAGHRRHVFAMFVGGSEQRCVRSRRHKLIRNFGPGRYATRPVDLNHPGAFVSTAKPPVELYDLEQDPDESDNLAEHDTHTPLRDGLDAVLIEHLRAVRDPILSGPMRLPAYERAVATIPAVGGPDRYSL